MSESMIDCELQGVKFGLLIAWHVGSRRALVSQPRIFIERLLAICQMRLLRHRKVMWLAQGHGTSKWQSRDVTQVECDSRDCPLAQPACCTALCSFSHSCPRNHFHSKAGIVAIIIRICVSDTKSFIINPQSFAVRNMLCHCQRSCNQEGLEPGQR